MAVAPFQPNKHISFETALEIVNDPRSSGVLAFVYGVTPKRIRNIKFRLAKHKNKNISK